MKKNIVILIFILVFIAILFLLDLPAYNKVTSLREELKKHQDFLKEKEEIVAKVDQLKQVYESRQSELKKVLYVLPVEEELPNLIVQFEALSSENGLILESLNFVKQAVITRSAAAEDVEQGKTSQPSTTSPATETGSQRDYKTQEIFLSVSGSYKSFKSFLEALELNIRLMDIKSINFKAQKEGAGFTFDINLQVYYQ